LPAVIPSAIKDWWLGIDLGSVQACTCQDNVWTTKLPPSQAHDPVASERTANAISFEAHSTEQPLHGTPLLIKYTNNDPKVHIELYRINDPSGMFLLKIDTKSQEVFDELETLLSLHS